MYRAPSKRTQLIKRVAVYSAMTTAVVMLVTFLVFIMLGYRFNRDTSTIQQGGLVQFSSRPGDANVTIGNAKLTDLTPSKITVNPGNYDVTMKRQGYHDWTKNVDVRAGQVLWLNYTQLVPTEIATDSLLDFASIGSVKAAPNGDRYALIEKPASSDITMLDVTGDTPKRTTLALPSDVLPAQDATRYSIVSWADDSDRFLVSARYGKSTEWLVVDRRDASRTVNISAEYEDDIREAIFDPRSSERVIIRSTDGDVRIVDTAADSLSGVIARSVSSMSLYGRDAIVVVQRVAEGGQAVGYVSFGSSELRVLKRIESSSATKVAIGKYFSDVYVAIASGTQLDSYKLDGLPPSGSEEPISMTAVHSSVLPSAATHLTIRTGGRLVVAQYATGVQVYDIELDRQTVTSFKRATSQELRWLDRYHFYLTNGAQLQVMEFDGGNAHDIAALTTGFDAVQSDNGTFIYSIAKSENGYSLQRSRMILEN